MNKKFIFTVAIFSYTMTACGPSAQAQTATVQAAIDRSVDATMQAMLSATQTAEGPVTEEPCVPPTSPEDPFNPETRLLLDEWESWDGAAAVYDTPIGTYSYEYQEGQIIITNPASQQLQELPDRLLRGASPSAFADDGSKLRLGPIFFYRCGSQLFINDQYIDRASVQP